MELLGATLKLELFVPINLYFTSGIPKQTPTTAAHPNTPLINGNTTVLPKPDLCFGLDVVL